MKLIDSIINLVRHYEDIAFGMFKLIKLYTPYCHQCTDTCVVTEKSVENIDQVYFQIIAHTTDDDKGNPVEYKLPIK